MFNYNLEFRGSILNRITNFFVFQTIQAGSTARKSPTKKNRVALSLGLKRPKGEVLFPPSHTLSI